MGPKQLFQQGNHGWNLEKPTEWSENMGTLLENEEKIMIDSDFFGVLSDNPDHRLFGNPIES